MNQEISYERSNGMATFFNKVFLLMMLGVFTTFAVTYGVIYFGSADLAYFIYRNYFLFIIAELAVVLVLRFRMMKLSSFGAMMCFLTYSILTGFTFVILCMAYGSAIFTSALLTTAGYFLILTVVGFVGKKDLSDMASTLRISLIAVIALSVINLFFYSDIIDLFITVSTLLIFTGFTIFDIRMLKRMYIEVESGQSESSVNLSKIAVYGALALYMDFINLFISILKIFGRANRN